MKSKSKFTCDYCQKTFVTSRFFKQSHKNTVAHIQNRGKYYEHTINQHKLKVLRRQKKTLGTRSKLRREDYRDMERLRLDEEF